MKNYNLGSKEAVALGCSCAIVDNHYGDQYFGDVHGFWIAGGCPLHDKSEMKANIKLEYTVEQYDMVHTLLGALALAVERFDGKYEGCWDNRLRTVKGGPLFEESEDE